MDKLENVLKRQLNEERGVPYPDFDAMWQRMEQEEPLESRGLPRTGAGRRRFLARPKIAAAALLSVSLLAAPVYAAIQYNWGNVLRDKGGIQAVLDKNMGQSLEQSVTVDGITLTLHTAIVDENRTVILYSMDIGDRSELANWNVEGLSLQDDAGNRGEGEYNYEVWDEQNRRYTGYFESDWTPAAEEENVTLTADGVKAYSQHELPLALNVASNAMQSFPIDTEGMGQLTVQPFHQSAEKLLISSAVTFTDPAAKDWANPTIVAYNGETSISALPEGVFGTPGDHGEYTMKQYFETAKVSGDNTAFKLQYIAMDQNITGPWSFSLKLSKKEMESGTIISGLNQPLEPGDTVNSFEKMVITPTQIRVSIRSKENFARLPYHKYYLEVGGETLEGYLYRTPEDDHGLAILRFERPSGLAIEEDTPVTFVGKYKVTEHEDDKEPLLLTGISASKQTLIRDTGGYSVQWTYFMQGKDLYVETHSEDNHFGGVNQTYIKDEGKERLIGKQVTINFTGDGNNKAIDVYKDFQGTEASIYMFFYTTDEPDKETRVQLRP